MDLLSSVWREGGTERGLITKDGKLSLCQGFSTNESLTDAVIKTSLEFSEAVQKPLTAKHICVFTWVSLRTWLGTSHYSDKWLRTGNALSGSRGGEGNEGVNYDKEKILIAFCTYQSLEVI